MQPTRQPIDLPIDKAIDRSPLVVALDTTVLDAINLMSQARSSSSTLPSLNSLELKSTVAARSVISRRR